MKFFLSKNINRILLIGALLPAAACSDFLDEVNPSALQPETFYTTATHAEAALAAVYANTRFLTGNAGPLGLNYFMLDEVTGTVTTETGQNTDQNNLMALAHDGNTLHIMNWWSGLYAVISNANLVIEKVPPITPMDEAQKIKILGEARFLRAWAYFYAVRIWGDVPLIVTPQTTGTADYRPSRDNQEEIYNQIVEDLQLAEAAGLPWMDVSGRVSLAAVKAQLAKVYLTMAGHPLNKGASHYQLAADKANEVITYANANPGEINLFATYGDLHNVNTENRVEHLFSVQYHSVVQANNELQSLLLPNFKAMSRYNNGAGAEIPTKAYYDSFEPGDLRTTNQQGYFYTSYFAGGSGDVFDMNAPYIFKHFDVVAHGSPGVTGTQISNLNIPQIRYAEVLLIYAEAQNEVGGPTQGAYDAFKRIRDRAQLVTPDLGTYTQGTFREAVWKERWHELCFENITWFDMVRLRKVFNENTKGFDDFEGHVNLNSNQTLQAKHLLFPLPRLEMLYNPNLGAQNPGY